MPWRIRLSISQSRRRKYPVGCVFEVKYLQYTLFPRGMLTRRATRRSGCQLCEFRVASLWVRIVTLQRTLPLLPILSARDEWIHSDTRRRQHKLRHHPAQHPHLSFGWSGRSRSRQTERPSRCEKVGRFAGLDGSSRGLALLLRKHRSESRNRSRRGHASPPGDSRIAGIEGA